MPSNTSNLSRPDALQDFLSTPPTWLLHSGMGLMCTFVFAALAMSWFIRYPDRIQATVLIRTHQAPVEVVCASGGRLDSILVSDQQWVAQGQPLCLLQNTANWADIQVVERMLKPPSITKRRQFHTAMQLGDVQTSFAAWQQIRQGLQQFLAQTLTQEQIAALQQEAQHNGELAQALDQRRELYQQELELVQREYERARVLNTQKVISDQELENKKTAWLQARRSAHNMHEEAIQNRVQMEQLHTEQLRLRAEYQNEWNDHQRNLQQATQQLQAAIALWKQSFLITAPIDGQLAWQTGLGQGQYINGSKAPGTIIPAGTQGLVAICTAPTTGIGRMSIGNRVQIDLDAFPPDEFGHLKGKVQYISRLPSPDQEGKFNYQIEVQLPDKLRSSYGKIIPFRQNLSGTARIVTKERRMLEKLIGKLWQMTNFSNNE